MHTKVLEMIIKQGIEDTTLVYIEDGQKAYRLRTRGYWIHNSISPA